MLQFFYSPSSLFLHVLFNLQLQQTTNFTTLLIQPDPCGPFFRGDWSWNNFYGLSPPPADTRRAVGNYVHKVLSNCLVKACPAKVWLGIKVTTKLLTGTSNHTNKKHLCYYLFIFLPAITSMCQGQIKIWFPLHVSVRFV